MDHGLIEIQACIASLEQMIDRVKKLKEEYDARKTGNGGPPASSLEHAITFAELRSLDLLCKDTLERMLPEHPKIAEDWYVAENLEPGTPNEALRNLRQKKIVMQYALNLAVGTSTSVGLPRGYEKLADSRRLFFRDSRRSCEDYDRNVFIMTRLLADNQQLFDIDQTVRDTLKARGFAGHRADDRCYPNDRNLWDNVCTYMLCCKYGVAILEDVIGDDFNPNVALEYGFMRALGKPTLLLKERRFKPRADILGTLWHEFDILDIRQSVAKALNKWLDDVGH